MLTDLYHSVYSSKLRNIWLNQTLMYYMVLPCTQWWSAQIWLKL